MLKKPTFSYKALASILSTLGVIIVQVLNKFDIIFSNDIVANIISAILAVGVVVGFVGAPLKETPEDTKEPENMDEINIPKNSEGEEEQIILEKKNELIISEEEQRVPEEKIKRIKRNLK